MSLFTGMTPVQLANRVARVTRPAKTTTQSGSFNAREWEVTWDTPERWENPLMGWASTFDEWCCLLFALTRPGPTPSPISS